MSFENKITFTIFGASHADSIGVSIDGFGFGEPIDLKELQAFVDRRKASASVYSTKRMEPDEIVVESGIENGVTSGREIVARIYNKTVRSKDYSQFNTCPRPSHADYVAKCKFGKDYDVSGGGAFSGRMTAPMCIAGGIALQYLKRRGVEVYAYIQSIGGVNGASYKNTNVTTQMLEGTRKSTFPLIDEDPRAGMLNCIEKAAREGDSVGGVIECVVLGVKPGVGNVMCDSLESIISKNLFAIPAVKGVEFGSGFDVSSMLGSQANDEFYYDENKKVKTYSNNNGGINGGLANGMPITLRVAFKPVPSISKEQRTINIETGENTTIKISGRHDSCFVPRAVPVVEAMVALSLVNVIK